MEETKMVTPLFYGYSFNRQGKKIRATVDRVVSNGADVYTMWRKSGKPDYPDAAYDDDMYALGVEVNGYLVPIYHTYHSLVKACGRKPAVSKLFGSEENRSAFFEDLRDNGAKDSEILEYCNQEERETWSLGSDPARQADFIKSFLDRRRDAYLSSKQSGSAKLPDFIGATIADDLAYCVDLSERCRKEQEERDREQAKIEHEKKEIYCREQNAVAEKKIANAMDTIRTGGTIKNESVTIYKTVSSQKTMTIVSAVMKAVGMEVPVRTKGWIEHKLVHIVVSDGKCTDLRFMKAKGCKCPEGIFDYLDQMVKAVKEREEGVA